MTYHKDYLRDMDKYPIGPKDAGEDVNPQPGKCNFFEHRYKQTDQGKKYGEAYPIYILQHNTVGSFQSVVQAFTRGPTPLSSHYVIDKDGKIYYFVANQFRAYHAGKGCLAGKSCLADLPINGDMNSWSIGIENVNSGNEPYTDDQIRANLKVCQDLVQDFSTIEPMKMLGHSDWSPGRKIDPNPYFPWDRFANAQDDPMFQDLSLTKNFGVFPRKADMDLSKHPKVIIPYGKEDAKLSDHGSEIQSKLRKYGYGITEADQGFYTDATRNAILSFQLHFCGKEILADSTLKEAWERTYRGGYSPVLHQFDENHEKFLNDILDQFGKH